MTMFMKLEEGVPTGNPIMELTFRQMFTSIPFPKIFTEQCVKPHGYCIYDYTSVPEVGVYEKAVEGVPVRTDSGIWRQSWTIVEMDEAEKEQVDQETADMIRAKRNAALAVSDWVAIVSFEKSTSIPSEWLSYRQALRDITAHKNFPYFTDEDFIKSWPTEPE